MKSNFIYYIILIVVIYSKFIFACESDHVAWVNNYASNLVETQMLQNIFRCFNNLRDILQITDNLMWFINLCILHVMLKFNLKYCEIYIYIINQIL